MWVRNLVRLTDWCYYYSDLITCRRLEILLGRFPFFWINIGLEIQGTVQNPSPDRRGPQRPPPADLEELIAHPNRPPSPTCGSLPSLLPSCPPLLLYVAGNQHAPPPPPPTYEPDLAKLSSCQKGVLAIWEKKMYPDLKTYTLMIH